LQKNGLKPLSRLYYLETTSPWRREHKGVWMFLDTHSSFEPGSSLIRKAGTAGLSIEYFRMIVNGKISKLQLFLLLMDMSSILSVKRIGERITREK
jgi:hypothetical protein